MRKQYPDNYEEEWDAREITPMVSSYAPPEFMGLIRDSRNQYRGRSIGVKEERENQNE